MVIVAALQLKGGRSKEGWKMAMKGGDLRARMSHDNLLGPYSFGRRRSYHRTPLRGRRGGGPSM